MGEALMEAPPAFRRRRKSLVVLAGRPGTGETVAQALVDSLASLGVQTTTVRRETSPQGIAAAVANEHADTVELCLARGGDGVALPWSLLHELAAIGRRDVSIVVHKID
jgi:hypothetical protein